MKTLTTVPDPDVAPPAGLVAFWRGQGVAAPDAVWLPLSGGRTNRLWRVDGPHGAAVIKLFHPDGVTPLFGNDPAAERAALDALLGQGLAPDLLGVRSGEEGQSIAYGHLDGTPWRSGDDPGAVGRALSRLHRTTPPALPLAPSDPASLRAQTRAILQELGPGAEALRRLEPADRDALAIAPHMAFLHGDATAANTLVRAGEVVFVDWQCPALGDPVLDIATFLSPGMQVISCNQPLRQTEVNALFEGYGDPSLRARYHALAPLLHWRMAAHCAWRAARGDAGYAAAVDAELAALRTAS